MLKNSSKSIEPAFFYILLIIICYWQLYSWIFPFKDFNWLAFFHHDLIYQVERFLLNLSYPGIEMLNSSLADYGSELWLLIPFYKLYELFASDSKPIHAYYFLTIFHLISGIFSFTVIRFLFKRYTGNPAGASLIVLILMSSPLFVQYFSFVKPDPNVVLLCILVSLSAICLFYETANMGWLMAAVIASALGAAIKWWSAFMLFPIIYAVLIKEKGTGVESLKLKYTYLSVIISFIILYIVQFLAVQNAIAALIANGEPVLDPVFISSLPALKKRLYEIILFLNQKSGIVISLALTIIGAFICCAIISFLYRIKQRPSQSLRKQLNYLFQSVKIAPIFIAFFLIFDLPFLLSSQFVESVYDFSQSLNLGVRSSASSRNIGILLNTREWLNNLAANNLLSFFTGSGVLFSMYIYIKKLRKDEKVFILNVLLIYLVFLLIFLFFFITRKAAAVQTMLFALLVFFIVFSAFSFMKYLSGYKKRTLIVLVVLFSLLQIVWQNAASSSPSAYSLYTYRYRYALADNVKSLNMQLLNAVNGDNAFNKKQRLLLCQRDFPIDGSAIKYRLLEFKVCRSPEKLMAASIAGDMILFTDTQRDEGYKNTVDSLMNTRKITYMAAINGKSYRLEGDIREYKAYLYLIN